MAQTWLIQLKTCSNLRFQGLFLMCLFQRAVCKPIDLKLNYHEMRRDLRH